jgi:hypothetical protein
MDLDNPGNAFTVWSEGPNGPVNCGGSTTLQGAIRISQQHIHLKNIVILSANPKHGLTRLADHDRINSDIQPPPGSGAD